MGQFLMAYLFNQPLHNCFDYMEISSFAVTFDIPSNLWIMDQHSRQQRYAMRG
jgi:hypothetical protein